MGRKPQIGGIRIALALGLAICMIALVLVVSNRSLRDGFEDRSPKNVAMIFSGRVKAYRNVLPKLLRIKETYNPVIFCSLNDIEMTEEIKMFCNDLGIPRSHLNVEQTIVPNWVGKCKLVNPVYNVYSMYYHENKAFSMVEDYMNRNQVAFDCILQYRADMDSKDELRLVIPEKNTIYIPNDRGYAGYNDRMAYGDYESMKVYYNLINVFGDLCNEASGNPINAEIMLKKYLVSKPAIKIVGIPYNTRLHEKRNEKVNFGLADA